MKKRKKPFFFNKSHDTRRIITIWNASGVSDLDNISWTKGAREPSGKDISFYCAIRLYVRVYIVSKSSSSTRARERLKKIWTDIIM